jgi:hypothetical protein
MNFIFLPGGVGIALFTLSFDGGDVVPEFDGNLYFVVRRDGLNEIRGCLIHFPFSDEAITSFMANFVTVRAGYLVACSTSSSPSFAFGIGTFVRSRFPRGFIGAVSFVPGFTFPFVLPFSFPGIGVVRLMRFDITKFLALFGGVIRIRVEITGF